MIIGETLQPKVDPGALYETPWIPRNGDFGEFLIDIIDFLDTGVKLPSLSVTATLQTKNSEDIDSAATGIGTIGPLTASSTPPMSIGAFAGKFTGAKELVRCRFTIIFSGTDHDAWIHLRALNISWATN